MYEDNYDDIINLPRPEFPRRGRMTRLNRAAQFSSFAALTGYEDAIRETARLTCDKIELSEDEKAGLDRKLKLLCDKPGEASITYFLPDKSKKGGEYITKNCSVREIDRFERVIIMRDKSRIPIDDIIAVDFPGCPD